MPKLVKKLFSLLFTLVFILVFSYPTRAGAQITDCDAVLTPNQIDPGSTNNFSVTVTNGSADRIRYLKFTRPSANFTLSTITASGWTLVSSDADSFVVNASTINTGVSRTFTLNSVVAANVNSPSANWKVEASHDNSGSEPYSCTGTLGTQIGEPDVTAPVISNIAVSNLTSSSVLISWSTDEPSNSRANYGLSASYGSNVSNSPLMTSHSLSISGLLSNTGYHFQVISSDASNNTASSSDNTFLTQAATTTTTTITTTTTQKPSTSTDKSLPIVNLTTNLSQVYKETPNIIGSASDDSGLVSIEYSTDGGNNWLPVDKSQGLNTKAATFEFKPQGLPDGNYDILVRAIDSSGNEGFSNKAVLIIDKLPPVIGTNIVSFGSQIAATKNNLIYAVIGVDQKITIPALGGPTSFIIKATSEDQKEVKFFSLTKTLGTNLWSGILAFDQPGNYSMQANAVDGANNKVSRELNKVFVNAPSLVTNKSNQPISNAEVSVHTYDEETSSWYLWNGGAFGQQNPQSTNAKGEFNFFLPTGKYFVSISAADFYSKNSEIFVNDKARPLAVAVVLREKVSLSLGELELTFPIFSWQGFEIPDEDSKIEALGEAALVNAQLPEFSLQNSDRSIVKSLDLSSKPTLLTFMSTWAPSTEEQITALEELSENTNYNIFVISSLESVEKISAYRKIGGYKLSFLVDPTGEILNKYNTLTIPQHIFVKPGLQIQSSQIGVLSKEELQRGLDSR